MNSSTKSLMTIAACTMIAAQPVAAQQLSAIRVGVQQTPPRRTRSHHPRVAAAMRESHWKEGAVIGTILVGTPAAIWMGSYAETSIPVAILGGLVSGALTGGVLGTLIGGQFPKGGGSPTPADDREIASSLRSSQ